MFDGGTGFEAYLKQIKMFSRKFEFSAVIVIAFGYFTIGSVLAFLFPAGSSRLTASHFHFLIIYEITVLISLGSFLRLRGWKLDQMGLTFSAGDLLNGAGLAIAAYIAYVATWSATAIFLPDTIQTVLQRKLTIPDMGPATIVAVSIINPVFEEIFVCGYVISTMKEVEKLWPAIITSMTIRLLYHLYQGPLAFISIIPIGLVFGCWFARTGRLWPIIAAHAAFDVIALQYRS